jgi:DNA-binding HxlR family transcriptional regulator
MNTQEQTHAAKILARLRRGPCRFSQLARDVGLSNSHNVLSATLKVLIESGVVERKVVRLEPPAHTIYSLILEYEDTAAANK